MSEANTFKKGDFVTVVRDRERCDQSYRGDSLEVIHSEGRFIIVRRIAPESFVSHGKITLSLDRYEIAAITNEFVEAQS